MSITRCSHQFSQHISILILIGLLFSQFPSQAIAQDSGESEQNSQTIEVQNPVLAQLMEPGETVATLAPALEWEGDIYEIHYITDGNYKLSGSINFWDRQTVFTQNEGLNAFVVTRNYNYQETDAAKLKVIFKLYATAYALYELPPSEFELNFGWDLDLILNNPLFWSLSPVEFITLPQWQREEALRAILMDETSQSAHESDLTSMFEESPETVGDALDMLSLLTKPPYDRGNPDFRTEFEEIFENLDRNIKWTEGYSVLFELFYILSITEEFRTDRAMWLATYQDSFKDGGGSFDSSLNTAVDNVLHEIKETNASQKRALKELVGEVFSEKVIEKASRSFTQKYLVNIILKRGGTTALARKISSSLSTVGIGLTVSNIMYGTDDLAASFQIAKRTQEFHRTFRAGRHKIQMQVQEQREPEFYNSNAVMKYQAALLLEHLSYVAGYRSYADGIEAVASRYNLVSLIHFLNDRSWQSVVDNIRSDMERFEKGRITNLAYPKWLDSSVMMARLRTILPTQPLSSFAYTYNVTEYVNLDDYETLRLGRGLPEEISYSPDGSMMAIISRQGISIYAVDGSEPMRFFAMPDLPSSNSRASGFGAMPKSAITWSPDGTKLVTGSADGFVRVWDVNTGKILHALSGHTSEVTSVSWAAKTGRLASGSFNGIVHVWDINSWQMLQTVNIGDGGIERLRWAPDGERFGISTVFGTLRIWDTAAGQPIDVVDEDENLVGTRSLGWSPNGANLAVGLSDGAIKVLDVESSEIIQSWDEHTGLVSSLEWSPDGSRVASGAYDATVRIWNMDTGQVEHLFEGHTRGYRSNYNVESVSWSPDGRYLASGASSDATIQIWDTDNGETVAVVEGHTGKMNAVDWSSNNLIVSGSSDGKARVWNVASGEVLQTIHEESDLQVTTEVKWSPDGSKMAISGTDSTVRIWDTDTQKTEHVFDWPVSFSEEISWSSDNKFLAASSSMGEVGIWDTSTWEMVQKLEGSLKNNSWSSDGSQFVTSSHNNIAQIWDVATGELVHTLEGHSEFLHSVDWSPSNSLIATSSRDGTVRLWDPATGQNVRVLANNLGDVMSVRWSPDGTRLAAGMANQIIIWDGMSGQQIQTLQGKAEQFDTLAWSPDSKQLVSGSNNGTIRVWDTSIIPSTSPLEDTQFAPPANNDIDLPLVTDLTGYQDILYTDLNGDGVEEAIGTKPSESGLPTIDLFTYRPDIYQWQKLLSETWPCSAQPDILNLKEDTTRQLVIYCVKGSGAFLDFKIYQYPEAGFAIEELYEFPLPVGGVTVTIENGEMRFGSYETSFHVVWDEDGVNARVLDAANLPKPSGRQIVYFWLENDQMMTSQSNIQMSIGDSVEFVRDTSKDSGEFCGSEVSSFDRSLMQFDSQPLVVNALQNGTTSISVYCAKTGPATFVDVSIENTTE